MNLKSILNQIIQERLEHFGVAEKPKCGCGCGGCEKAPKVLNESVTISNSLKYHIDNKKAITENLYRFGSESHKNLLVEVRTLWEKGDLELKGDDLDLFYETDLGKTAIFEGKKVHLDYPLLEEVEEIPEAKHQGREVQLNKPKRGGPKKFYVYVRKPGGGVKKVNFGDTTGLKAKINNPKARQAFAKRHKCAQAKDKTTPKYWSCRLPRYASLLGMKSNFSGYW